MSEYILTALNPCTEVLYNVKYAGDPIPDNKCIGVSDVPRGSWGCLEIWMSQLSKPW